MRIQHCIRKLEICPAGLSICSLSRKTKNKCFQSKQKKELQQAIPFHCSVPQLLVSTVSWMQYAQERFWDCSGEGEGNLRLTSSAGLALLLQSCVLCACVCNNTSQQYKPAVCPCGVPYVVCVPTYWAALAKRPSKLIFPLYLILLRLHLENCE